MAQRSSNQAQPDEDGPPHPADRAENGGQVAAREEHQRPVSMAPILGPPEGYGQATRVQMAAAIAEVQAMVVTAQARPRHMGKVLDDVLAACDQPFMAEMAFYEYSRGEGKIKGITVQLARELLRCFRNAQSGIIELQRLGPTGTEPGRSEMQAWAWDMETNVRMSTTFWATHTRDRSKAKGGPVALEAERDIYENNANLASRRERAMIERILPAYLMEEAKERCMLTLRGDSKTLPQRIERCIQRFGDTLGIPVEVLEARIGRPHEVWGGPDLANLLVVYRSLERGETTREEAFADQVAPSAAKATDAALAGGQSPPPAGQGAATTPERDTAPPPAGGDPAAPGPTVDEARAQALREIRAAFTQAKWGGNAKDHQETRRAVVSMLARVDQTADVPVPVQTATDLDAEQAARVAQRLGAILGDATHNPHDALAALAAEARTWQQPEGGQ